MIFSRKPRNSRVLEPVKALPLIQQVLKSEQFPGLGKLLRLHRMIHNLNAPLPKFPQSCIANNILRPNVFNLTESMDLMICLPPKSGTTNWQKGLDVHYLKITKGEKAAKIYAEKLNNHTAGKTTYNILPRVDSPEIHKYSKEGKSLQRILTASNRVANTRKQFFSR